METVLQKLLNLELASAKNRNPTLDLFLTTVGMLLFAILLLTTTNHGYWGFALGSMYVWHRYVVLNLVEKQQ